ncbi:Beta-galactosidase-1-like protein 2, partial [Ophiophagus hannah]
MRFWGRVLGLQAKHSQFLLEEKPFRILGGSMHYFRIPREYWRDRLVKMKACGLNTLTTGRGSKKTARGLEVFYYYYLIFSIDYLIVFLPSWLLQDPEMQLRTTYKGFTEAVDSYFDNLMPQVVHLQYKNGGPIIAMQVENEYGSYAQDQNYMAYVKQALLSRNVVELLVTSDNKDGLNAGIVEGESTCQVNQECGITRALSDATMTTSEEVAHDMPTMVMEYWTGWFDSWGGPHNVFDADEMLERVENVLRAGASINLYMFHGGTNFGFMNGALHFNDYKATVTSYDYDAVLTEAGDYTAKYFKLRKLFSSMIVRVTQDPVLVSVLQIVKSEYPINMENLPINNGNGQAFGYTLYETVILGGGTLYSRDYVRDRAQVRMDVQETAFSFSPSLRGASPWSAIPDSAVGPAFFRGTLQVQYVPQDTFLKLEIVIFEERLGGRIIHSTDLAFLGRVQYVT